MSEGTFLSVKPDHHLLSEVEYTTQPNKNYVTYCKVDCIVHFVCRSKVGQERRRSILDEGTWYTAAPSLKCRVMTDGSDDVINDEKLGIVPSGFAQLCEYLAGVRVTPVVKDLLEDENGGILDGLRREKVVRLEVDATFFYRFWDFLCPKL